MNKTEIIQRVAYNIVPDGTRLAVDESIEPEDTDTLDTQSPDEVSRSFTSALKIALARVSQEAMGAALSDLSNTPDAILLLRLHEACIKMTERTIQALTVEELNVDVIDDHRKMVTTIAEIAKELGIEYEPPNDRFVQ